MSFNNYFKEHKKETIHQKMNYTRKFIMKIKERSHQLYKIWKQIKII
jgi:hypothetical protein